MSVSPKACVLLPYRNAYHTLEEAVDCMLAQEKVDVHLIAIDDGSSDESATLMRRLASQHKGIELVTSGGVGIVGALECGARHLTSRWVARMDADDRAHPERLAAQIEMLHADPSLGAVGTQVEAFPRENVKEGLRLYLTWQNAILSKEDHARELFVESPLCHPSVTMRRSAYEEVGRYRDSSWAEDYDLWLRLWAAGYALTKVPRVLTSWRHHEGQLTFRDGRYSKAEFRNARAHYLAPHLRRLGREVVVWGAGPTGKRLSRELRAQGVETHFFIDIDAEKIGRTRQGKPVHSPEFLRPAQHTIVVAVGARGARELIRAHLIERDFVESRDFIVAS